MYVSVCDLYVSAHMNDVYIYIYKYVKSMCVEKD